MIACYLDASAWSKRYTAELGWEALNVFFEEPLVGRSVILLSAALSYAEVVSVCVRFRNRTALSDEDFDAIARRIADDEKRLIWLPLPEETFHLCTGLIVKHNVNATDAALLWALSILKRQRGDSGTDVWLVASDKRLLRAASLEGLQCLDPEVSSPREVRDFLATH